MANRSPATGTPCLPESRLIAEEARPRRVNTAAADPRCAARRPHLPANNSSIRRPGDETGRLVHNGFNPERAADVVFIPEMRIFSRTPGTTALLRLRYPIAAYLHGRRHPRGSYAAARSTISPSPADMRVLNRTPPSARPHRNVRQVNGHLLPAVHARAHPLRRIPTGSPARGDRSVRAWRPYPAPSGTLVDVRLTPHRSGTTVRATGISPASLAIGERLSLCWCYVCFTPTLPSKRPAASPANQLFLPDLHPSPLNQ